MADVDRGRDWSGPERGAAGARAGERRRATMIRDASSGQSEGIALTPSGGGMTGGLGKGTQNRERGAEPGADPMRDLGR